MVRSISVPMLRFYRTWSDRMGRWFDDLLEWRQKKLSDRQFTLVLAFMVGVFAAIAAFILHTLIHIIQRLVMRG